MAEFKPDVGKKVSRTSADSWIKRYDDQLRLEKDKDTKSVFFGKDRLREILDTEGAEGISFFLALKDNPAVGKETVTLVLIPTALDGKLIYTTEGAGKDPGDPMVWDDGNLCPYNCPEGNG